jgi:hypothetical protein
MGLERAHAQGLGQRQGLLIGGFGLCDRGGIGVGLDDTKLVQRARLVPACLLLSGQVERLACVLPSLLAATRQITDPAERSPRFAVTPSPCLCVQYLVLLVLTRFYTVQSPPELLLFRLAQLSKAAQAQRDTA